MWRNQNKEIFFSAFSVEGCGEEPIKNWKEISLFWVRAVSERQGAQNWQEPECVRKNTKPPRARRVADQSLRDWSKKVCATVIISPQIETSCSERTEVSRAFGAAETQAGRKPRLTRKQISMCLVPLPIRDTQAHPDLGNIIKRRGLLLHADSNAFFKAGSCMAA